MHIIQIYSGITRGRVHNGELNTQRLQKLIYLCLSTECFMTISLHSSGQIIDMISQPYILVQRFGKVSGWLVLIIS